MIRAYFTQKPLVSYYTDKVNIYKSCAFMALPVNVSTAVPRPEMIHRVTHCGEPYPTPYHSPPFHGNFQKPACCENCRHNAPSQ